MTSLKTYREKAKLSVAKLAMKAKLDERTVRGIEAAEMVPVWESIPRLGSLVKYFVGCGHKLAEAQVAAEAKLSELQQAAAEISVNPWLELILRTAIEQKASDVHIEPTGIRFRVNGVLVAAAQFDIPDGFLNPQAKISANAFTIRCNGFETTVRQAVLGSHHVYRMGRAVGPKTLEDIFVSEEQLRILKFKLQLKSGGLIIVCGPTGNGKSTTVYAILNNLCSSGINIVTEPNGEARTTSKNLALSGMIPEARNIVSIEDPIEIKLNGVRQWEVNHASGNDFETLLKNSIRQDPDVLSMEIRDTSTAHAAIEAAAAGRLVVATMHCNSAQGVLARLASLGVNRDVADEYLLVSIFQILEFVEDRTDRFAIVEMYANGKLSSRESCLVAATRKKVISEQTLAKYIGWHCPKRNSWTDELAASLPTELTVPPGLLAPHDQNGI